jgi:hypothetical protein
LSNVGDKVFKGVFPPVPDGDPWLEEKEMSSVFTPMDKLELELVRSPTKDETKSSIFCFLLIKLEFPEIPNS